jgi:hypothetical protein
MTTTLLLYAPKYVILPKFAQFFQHVLPRIILGFKSVTNIALTSEVRTFAFLLLSIVGN